MTVGTALSLRKKNKQGRMLAYPVGKTFMQKLLVDAGIKPSMRVLDVGCGGGFVSAMIVALGAQVVGIDSNLKALEFARQQVPEATFVQGELDKPIDGEFDAIVGRRVLMYVDCLGNLKNNLKDGGLVVFMEHLFQPIGDLPLHNEYLGYLSEMLKCEGASTTMGLDLRRSLSEHFDVQCVRAEAQVMTPEQGYPLARMLNDIKPRFVEAFPNVKIPGEAEFDEERINSKTTYIPDIMFGAWALKQ